MIKIIQQCWNTHRQLMNDPQIKDCLVKSSIPILWFGDMDAYNLSKIKVVTVGLNPSLREFPKDKDRFPNAVSLQNKKTLNAKDVETYTAAMNAYFETDPYKKRFNNFEKALNPLDSSYYVDKKMPNRAIHIDIYTPFATDPVWGGLSPKQKEYIDKRSNGLYENLLDILKPKVVLVSANKDVVKEHFPIDFKDYLSDTDTRRNYLRAGKTKEGCVVIWGKNNRGCPFNINKVTLEEKINQINKDYKL